MAKQKKHPDKDQAQRFKEAARELEVDETGKDFERALEKVISAKRRSKAPQNSSKNQQDR